VITMMPKAKGNAYFISLQGRRRQGPPKELGVELLFDGPTDSNAAKAKRDRRETGSRSAST